MIKFVFDNDALGHLVKDAQYEQLKLKILESRQRRQNQFFISAVTLWEAFKGTHEKNFNGLQQMLCEGLELAGEENVLPDPHDYLRFRFLRTPRREQRSDTSRLIAQIHSFLGMKSHSEFVCAFGEVVRYVSNEIEKIRASVDQSTARMNGHDELKRVLDPEKIREFSLVFFSSLLQHFRLEDAVVITSPKNILQTHPSLYYFASLYQILMRKRVFNGAKVRIGDFFDLERVIYLDTCDYLVTDDKALIDLFNNCRTPYMNGRAIRLNKLLDHVGRPRLLNMVTFPLGN